MIVKLTYLCLCVDNFLETGIPYAFYRCGFFLAIILLLVVALLVNRSIMYLVSCGLKTRKLDYEALCEHVLGKPGFYVATAAMWMFAYGELLLLQRIHRSETVQLTLILGVNALGAMVAYLIILGDVAPKVRPTESCTLCL